ncbi:MAG: GNAT family N-acetyltransferase [Planctomycetota bacterium]
MTDPPLIRAASPETRRQVLALAFSHLSAEDRDERTSALVRGVESNETLLDGLLEARRGGRLVGGIFSEIQPGKTAVVWPPRLAPEEPTTTGDQLLAVILELLHAKRVCVAYTLLEAGMEDDAPVLRAGGFGPLADLLYLVSTEEGLPRSRPASPLEFETYSAANHDRMARVVEATYDGTWDCPLLNGVRQADDILTGYRATGTFAPDRWLLVRHQGEDVGCLLLADHPEQENWELVYMGLVPAARGNGWGKEITRHAQWLTHQAHRARLLLAVDQKNDPAIRMYWTQGFQAWDRRSVYLRVLS